MAPVSFSLPVQAFMGTVYMSTCLPLYAYFATTAGQIGVPITEICSGVFNEVNTMNAKGDRNSNNRISVKPVTRMVLVIFFVL